MLRVVRYHRWRELEKPNKRAGRAKGFYESSKAIDSKRINAFY